MKANELSLTQSVQTDPKTEALFCFALLPEGTDIVQRVLDRFIESRKNVPESMREFIPKEMHNAPETSQCDKKLKIAACLNCEKRRNEIYKLRNEVNCRIEHGADSHGHLEYVQSLLDETLKCCQVQCD